MTRPELLPEREYDRIHHAARKLRKSRCERCRKPSKKLEAALRPEVPRAALPRDPRTGSLYSRNVADYFTLCVPCHRRMDFVELRTHCRKDHAYTSANTSVKQDGSRQCRACHRDQARERMKDPEKRALKNQRDREYRQRNPRTPEQKARKIELQRLRRQAAKEAV